MKNVPVSRLSSWLLAGFVALGSMLIAQDVLAQLPLGIPDPMPAATPRLRQVTVGRVTGSLHRTEVRNLAARSWGTIVGCVQNSGARVRQIRIRFVVVLGQSPQLVMMGGAPGAARACIAQEVASWRFSGGFGTAAVTFRTRGIDAAVAGAVQRVPLGGTAVQTGTQILEAGHEALGTQ
ncbi:MAG: hypothetical protein IT379_27315 [Deltaproteobacteria bacterium]|nr:hypothetical protein [Deltaproteobacteria bacterium]